MTEAQTNHIQQRLTAIRRETLSVADELRQKTSLGCAEERDVEAAIRLLTVANLLGQVESLTGLAGGAQGRRAGPRPIAA